MFTHVLLAVSVLVITPNNAAFRPNRQNAILKTSDYEGKWEPGAELAKIGVEGRWMADTYGRVRIFHGWNSVSKQPPWYRAEMLNDTKLEYYKRWGFNVVRLGCMWSGFEPEEGRYNETYIGIMKDIVTRLGSHGIYVILDMHQDVLSSTLASYDGVPLWVVDKFPPSPHPYPWPLRNITNWAEGYIAQATGRAFQYLYDNHAGTLDSMASFWATVASTFKDHDNVLGYELINEPWAGDIYAEPSLLEPGIAGRENLLPAYDKINAAIRVHDKKTLLFYEPVTWGVFLNGEHSGTGFDRVPGGPAYANVSVLAYHYYCWLLGFDQQHQPLSFLQKTICDKIVGPRVFPAIAEDLTRTGGSSFLTEFGICEPDGRANSTATVECDFVMNAADNHFASWTYWDDAFFDDQGNVRWNTTCSLARVYARAISGVPLLMTFNRTESTFRLKYQANLTIKQPTEVVVPKLHYPHGFEVKASKGVRWSFNDKERVLNVYLEGRMAKNLSVVEVNIKPKIS